MSLWPNWMLKVCSNLGSRMKGQHKERKCFHKNNETNKVFFFSLSPGKQCAVSCPTKRVEEGLDVTIKEVESYHMV